LPAGRRTAARIRAQEIKSQSRGAARHFQERPDNNAKVWGA
jgi:hypothetical protein